MTKLVMQQAPAPAIPQRFLLTASVWGTVAGGLLLWDGNAALASRWSSTSLAVVHAVTLGFLGNAMFGSLLQFLPVAAQVPVRGGGKAAWTLYGVLNLGALLLVLALRWPLLLPPQIAGTLLLLAFSLLLAMLLPGLWASQGQRFLRWGIACALLAAQLTALLGFVLTLTRAGQVSLALPRWTDVHASWGVFGWVLGLLAAVSRVVAPMFQGTLPASIRIQTLWQAALYGVLLAALLAACANLALPGFRVALGMLVGVFGLGGLLLQRRAAKLRAVPLTWFWGAGLLVLLAAAVVMSWRSDDGILAGTLLLLIGLPMLVTGMQLEICGFLAWIDLQRRCGRGVRLPGVQLLVPARDKYVVLTLQLLAGLTLVMALLRLIPANVAGAVLGLAHLATVAAQVAVQRRAYRYVQQHQTITTVTSGRQHNDRTSSRPDASARGH